MLWAKEIQQSLCLNCFVGYKCRKTNHAIEQLDGSKLIKVIRK